MSNFPRLINGSVLVQPTSYNRAFLNTDSLTVTVKGTQHLINGKVTLYVGKRGVTLRGKTTLRHLRGPVTINSAVVNGQTVVLDKTVVG